MNAPPPTKAKPGVTVLELPDRFMQQASAKFPDGVNILVVAPEDIQPEFIRLPKAGEFCPVTGLPRTTLIELLQQAGPSAVPVRWLRKPGATKGIAMIPRHALVNYINTLPAPDWQDDKDS